MVSFYWQTWEEVTLKRKLWSFEKFWFYWSWCSKLSGKKKKKKNARNSPKTGQGKIAMPSCRPPLLASWIKKEFLCGSFYAESHDRKCVDKRRRNFLCFYSFENYLNVRPKNWLDWPSCFFVLEESEVKKQLKKCFQKKFLHEDEVISKVKKAKRRRRYFNIWFNKNHLLGKQLNVTLVEKCSKLFKTSLKMTKRRIQPKMGYFLIWKEFVLVDFRQWIRQHVFNFCKKKFTLSFIKFLWSWTEDQFRDDIFFGFIEKECQKGPYWNGFLLLTNLGGSHFLKGNLWSFEKILIFIGSGVVSCLVKKKKKTLEIHRNWPGKLQCHHADHLFWLHE